MAGMQITIVKPPSTDCANRILKFSLCCCGKTHSPKIILGRRKFICLILPGHSPLGKQKTQAGIRSKTQRKRLLAG